MQMGVMMPSMRNNFAAQYINPGTHEVISTDSSALTRFKNPLYQYMGAVALQQRLLYIRYIYSQITKVHREGGSLVRPLFFDYPADNNTYDDVEHTYMLGNAIKASPVLKAGVTEYESYFPKGKWADLNDLRVVLESKGEKLKLTASDTYLNMHMKAGTIIPFQQKTELVQTTTGFQNKLRTQLIIFRDQNGTANGHL